MAGRSEVEPQTHAGPASRQAASQQVAVHFVAKVIARNEGGKAVEKTVLYLGVDNKIIPADAGVDARSGLSRPLFVNTRQGKLQVFILVNEVSL